MNIKMRLIAVALLAVALAHPADLKAEDGLTGSLGAAVAATPEFEGSDRYKARILPAVNLNYGPVFLSMRRGLGVNLVSAPGWTVAPAVRYRWARKESHSDLLKGLGDIEDGVEAGGVIRWQPGPAGLSLDVYQGLGRVKGLTGRLAANYDAALTDDLNGSVSLSTVFADRKYNQQHFGITPAQRAASVYPEYAPGAGLKHAAIEGSLSYDLTECLELGLAAEYRRLTGPAADSPLVKRGSANQFISALSVSFSF